jgi:hypothetical protein
VSVEDVENTANIQSSHHPKPKNPHTIIESSEDKEETAVPQAAATQKKWRRVLEAEAVPKKGNLRELCQSRMLRISTRSFPLTIQSPKIPTQLLSPQRVKTRLISLNLRF